MTFNSTPKLHNNINIASSVEDRSRMLRIISLHQLKTGQKLSLKDLVTILIDTYGKAYPDAI